MKLINRHQQKGLSGPGWLAVVGIFALIIVTIIKIFPMYYDSFKVQTVLKTIQEDPSIDVKSKRAIWEAMKKNLFINEVHSVSRENVKMSRKDGKTTVSVSYETRTPYIANLFIGGIFSETIVIDR